MNTNLDVAPQPMELHEKARFTAAAHRAKRVYPGAVGQLLFRELTTWYEFGYRLGGHQLINQAVDEIMKAPLPT